MWRLVFLLFIVPISTLANDIPYFLNGIGGKVYSRLLSDDYKNPLFYTSETDSVTTIDSTLICSDNHCGWQYDTTWKRTLYAYSSYQHEQALEYYNETDFSLFDSENDSCKLWVHIRDSVLHTDVIPDSVWGDTATRAGTGKKLTFSLKTIYTDSCFMTIEGIELNQPSDTFKTIPWIINSSSYYDMFDTRPSLDGCNADSIKSLFYGIWQWLYESIIISGSGGLKNTSIMGPQTEGYNKSIEISPLSIVFKMNDSITNNQAFNPTGHLGKTLSCTLFSRYDTVKLTIMDKYLVVSTKLCGISCTTDTSVYVRQDSIGVERVNLQAGNPGAELHVSPNPFNCTASICFSLPVGGQSQEYIINVYNIQGQLVRSIARGRLGNHTIQAKAIWDGRNNFGQMVRTGIYFCRLTAGDQTIVKRLVLTN